MKTKIILLLFVSLMLAIPIYAQSKANRDTVYYLLDTLHIPLQDRMITVEKANQYKFYTINCPCLEAGNKPVFRDNITNDEPINKRGYLKLKFIKLTSLIEMVRRNDNDQFDDRFVIYFIEAQKSGYLQHRMFFQGGHINKVY